MVWLFVAVVGVFGVAAISYACLTITQTSGNWWVLILALLTVSSSRFTIAVPGQPATVSVSEVFVFASILLFGPAPAILTVSLDGLVISLQQRDRRLYRLLFNMAEPALSTGVAAVVFFATAHTRPLAVPGTVHGSLLLPSAAMSMAYFCMNTLLQAGAMGVESGESLWALWRQHAGYVAINYYAAGALATLAVRTGVGVDLEVVGLAVPLLLLSYGAYKSAASRIADAQRHVKEIEHLYQATVETLAIAVDAKDQVTHGHIRRVQRHTLALGKALGITDATELKALEAASLLHDIGKLAVPDHLLNKPGTLDRSELERMKRHATTGATILATVEFPYPVVPIVRHHHEQWCGKGYPDGLAGEAIPLGARILTVVDCFDAVTSDRPYRRKLTDEEAIEILVKERGNMYDPRVVDAFVRLIPRLRSEDHTTEGVHGSTPAPLSVPDGGDLRPLIALEQTQAANALLHEALEHVAPGAEACFFIPQSDGLAASLSTPHLQLAVAGLHIPFGEGLVGWVAAHRHTIINSNADLDLGAAAQDLRLGVCCALPVFALGTLVGVLAVYRPRPGRFTDADVRRLGVLSQEIGSVLLPSDGTETLLRVRAISAA